MFKITNNNFFSWLIEQITFSYHWKIKVKTKKEQFLLSFMKQLRRPYKTKRFWNIPFPPHISNTKPMLSKEQMLFAKHCLKGMCLQENADFWNAYQPCNVHHKP